MEKSHRSKKGLTPRARLVIFYWLPVIVWMAFIFFLSGRHSVTVSPEYIWNFLFFKTLHLIEYSILYVVLTRAFNRTVGGGDKYGAMRIAFLLTVLYAATDELHQQFVPSREGRLRDVIIDAIGAGFVWFYLSKQLQKAPQKLKSLAASLDIPF